MKISRFFGITTREAMRQVRLALGPDALIVSNRRVAGGVEILATDSSAIPEADDHAPRGTAPATAAGPAAATRAATSPVPSVAPPPASVPMTGSVPAMPSPKSPLGAYAAAFQAAYGAPAQAAPAPAPASASASASASAPTPTPTPATVTEPAKQPA